MDDEHVARRARMLAMARLNDAMDDLDRLGMTPDDIARAVQDIIEGNVGNDRRPFVHKWSPDMLSGVAAAVNRGIDAADRQVNISKRMWPVEWSENFLAPDTETGPTE